MNVTQKVAIKKIARIRDKATEKYLGGDRISNLGNRNQDSWNFHRRW